MEQHHETVRAIALSVQRFHNRKKAFRIFHGSTNSTRALSLPPDSFVDTSPLKHILEVDKQARVVLAEPNVPMDELVAATLKHGLLPPVVMEFPGITVGGGYAGTCGESSSFRYGFFDRMVTSVEMVLGNGEVVVASEREHADLFRGAAGSLGTLGVATLLELRLVKTREYVELTYWPVGDASMAVERLGDATLDPANDYVDGIMFSLRSGVVMTGKLTDTPGSSLHVQTFHRPQDPWFYLHAQALASSDTPITEAIPLTSYLFRYDRGAFWTGAHAFRYFLTPFNGLTRWLLDYFLHARVLYQALHESRHMEQFLIQDLVLPQSNVETFIKYIDENHGIYPLWLCPLSKPEGKTSFHPHAGDEPPISIGVWGPGPSRREKFIQANVGLEKKLRELKGMKWLYAQVFYSKGEFWWIYDKTGYDALRKKYDATNLPSVWQKVRTDVNEKVTMKHKIIRIWPIGGLYGLWRTIVGRDYLVARDHTLLITLALAILVVALTAAILAVDASLADERARWTSWI